MRTTSSHRVVAIITIIVLVVVTAEAVFIASRPYVVKVSGAFPLSDGLTAACLGVVMMVGWLLLPGLAGYRCRPPRPPCPRRARPHGTGPM